MAAIFWKFMILTEISRHIPEILHIIFSPHKLPQVHTHCVQKKSNNGFENHMQVPLLTKLRFY